MIPRTCPPAPGWSPGGQRIKNEVDYGQGPERIWPYGALSPATGQELTMTAPSRKRLNYQRFLQAVEEAIPGGEIVVVTGTLSSHHSISTRTWLEDHPRITHAFIPIRATWWNLQEGWWRLFHRPALAGQSLAGPVRDRDRHGPGHRPARHPRPLPGLGAATATAPQATPEVHPPP